MKFENKTLVKIGIAGIALCLMIGLSHVLFVFPQEAAKQPPVAAPAAKIGGFPQVKPDPRVQMRSYLFKDTNEDMKYGVFVSSKVTKDKRNPLIVTLHGMGMGPEIMLRGKAIAPAAFMMQPSMLSPLKDTMPIILIQGDGDTVVPPANTRRWADKMKELNMNYKYVEVPSGDHGSVIDGSMPEVFAFFKEHAKPASK